MFYLLVLVGCIVVFVIAVKNPFYILSIFIMGHFIEPSQFFPGIKQYNLPVILAGIIIAGCIVHFNIYGRFSSPKSKQTKVLFLFLVWILFTFYAAPEGKLASYTWFLRCMMPYFLFLYLVNTEKEVTATVWILVIFATIGGLYGIYCLKMNIGVYDRGIKRITSFFSNPNSFANTLTLLVPFTLGFLFSKYKRFTKILIAWMLAIIITGVIISYSRKTFFTLLVGIFMFVLIFFKREQKIFAAFSAVVLLLGATYIFPDSVKYRYWSRIASLFEAESAQELDIGRTETAKAGLVMMQENPVFGVGLGGFGLAYYNIAGYSSDIELVASRHSDEEALGAHNLYIEVGGQLGVVGLLIFLIFILMAYRDAGVAEYYFRIRGKPNLEAIAVSFKVFIVLYLFLGIFSGVLYSKLFWITVPLSAVMRKVAIYNPESSNPDYIK